MDKHTSGPWHKTPYGKYGFLILHDNVSLAHVNGSQQSEVSGNASLISAAPDLLNALRELVHKCLHSDGYTQKIDELTKAQQAIEKATS